jgi:hypothetical protein
MLCYLHRQLTAANTNSAFFAKPDVHACQGRIHMAKSRHHLVLPWHLSRGVEKEMAAAWRRGEPSALERALIVERCRCRLSANGVEWTRRAKR